MVVTTLTWARWLGHRLPRSRLRRRLPALLTALVAALIAWPLTMMPAAASDGTYRLGPLDKVRIKVWEWRPAQSDTFEWTPLNGEFTVDAGGSVSLPLIGMIQAEGLTTAEVAASIGNRLKETVGLLRPPHAAVEIAQYRPFYIVGAVEKPGEYPFRPGMSLLQAVSIAGGFHRPETSLARFDRESIIAQGDVRVSETQRAALMVRRDRLQAESRGEVTLAFSAEITARQSEAAVAQAIREERLIFEARRRTLYAQIDLVVQANTLLQDELKTLAAKTQTQVKQVELARRELDNINQLMSRGLAVSARQVAVEQNLAQMESQLLDLSLATSRTRQDIGRNDRNIAELRNQRVNDVLRELRETQMTLDHVAERIDTFRGLLFDSQFTGPREQQLQADAASRLEMQVVRRINGRITSLPAEMTTEVLPGDVIRIARARGSVNTPDRAELPVPTR
jgi:protein involved in polysaccharide export with SLBB domain